MHRRATHPPCVARRWPRFRACPPRVTLPDKPSPDRLVVYYARVNHPSVSRVLIIKPSSLGDIVHALPVLAALREAHPRAHLAWLIGSSFAPLLEGHPLLDEVIPFDRTRFGRMWRSPGALRDFWRFVGALRRRRFDLVIDLQGLIRSGLMAWFSGAAQTIGFSHAREGAWLFYRTRVRCPASAIHAVEKNLCVARRLGLAVESPRFPLAIREDERRDAWNMFQAAAGRGVRSFTAVIPGARWESKRWPAERFAELIDRLADDAPDECVVLLGAPSERAIADAIVRATRRPPVNLVGETTLRQLVAMIDCAARVVCCDSGPMHIAAALDKPLAALFGPTDPGRTGPFSSRATVVTHRVPCAPCLRRVCPLRHHDCLEQVTAAVVAARVRELPTAAVTARVAGVG